MGSNPKRSRHCKGSAFTKYPRSRYKIPGQQVQNTCVVGTKYLRSRYKIPAQQVLSHWIPSGKVKSARNLSQETCLWLYCSIVANLVDDGKFHSFDEVVVFYLG